MEIGRSQRGGTGSIGGWQLEISVLVGVKPSTPFVFRLNSLIFKLVSSTSSAAEKAANFFSESRGFQTAT
jgi:hypothetical protein